ncbi:YtxH domain-containing protein [Nitrosospira sp. Nsp13]|uniref:YtxH domain-containing protein n=1 Tax=Nitrosospira sp. Nsp13 TaxID=1855332 RepID=UPI000882C313|nr:YtxH domain-containing protein [Nitrosospira sp. Nsp13]SCY34571.1 protein disulfide-isomerase [Nitrosospira sp. Nsp13]
MRLTLLAATLVALTMTACGKPNQALPEQEKKNFEKITSQPAPSSTVDDAKEKVVETYDAAKDKAVDAKDAVSEKVSEGADAVKETAKDVKEGASDTLKK